MEDRAIGSDEQVPDIFNTEEDFCPRVAVVSNIEHTLTSDLNLVYDMLGC
jgi:hypothetical protein